MPAPSPNTEKELLKEVSLGNENAFARLFHLHHHHLGQYIYQLTASRELAEEIVQDIFLRIWTNRLTLITVDNFRAWLFIISRNHALNCLRKLVSDRAKQQEWLKEQLNELSEREEPGSAQFELIDQAIDQLPPQQKKVFILSRYQRMKQTEIAAELNLSRETVKSYLQIATTSISKFVNSRALFITWLVLHQYFIK